jgi:hypothetical protein
LLRLTNPAKAAGGKFCRRVILRPTCRVQGVGETSRLNGGYSALFDHLMQQLVHAER